MRILGLDLSLTSTGYALIEFHNYAEVDLELTLYGRAALSTGIWYGSVGSTILREVDRLAMFDKWIHDGLDPRYHGPIDHVAIEGYSFGSPFNATSLGELGGVIKLAIQQAGIPLHIIPPKTWRKVLCGNGNIKKHDVSKELHKRYGVEFTSLDTLEAWAVATCLHRQLLGLDKPEPKIRKRKAAGELLEAMS